MSNYTTIKLSGGDLGLHEMLVRCNLSEASAPLQVDYCEGGGWDSTQYQSALAVAGGHSVRPNLSSIT